MINTGIAPNSRLCTIAIHFEENVDEGYSCQISQGSLFDLKVRDRDYELDCPARANSAAV